ncbi:ETX/MTX2 family pore-forming toxin [Melissococcus plutonius]|uniref:Melissotoxin A, MtxA n=2 Tax=Melissococcus plutonius TaxID=33970 RepID=A0A2Z5Y4Z9_9ENTE|nr:ETX/MTX2 family pore-forming toxin [Melissococcus plutonius]MCV2506001.1 ETX/MTX2 family pore-forming toxin [Melissococcus plutonius]MCV2520590.1 ETX/MTX2 family pore-forming toxin [Melissococcus plutonius]BBC61878.1 melissotoxin A, MtxA [Melissococcus plutonius]
MKTKFISTFILLFTLCILGAKNAQAATFTNIDNDLNDLGTRYYRSKLADTYQGYYLLDREPQSVSSTYSIDGTPNTSSVNLNTKNINSLYVGDNVFNNNSNFDQTYNTASFTKTVTETTSTSNTRGIKFGGKGLNFKLPFFIDGNEVTGDFNSSETDTTTHQMQTTLLSNSQPVKVPAHKKYKVTVSLEQINYDGIVDYTATGKNLFNHISTRGLWVTWSGEPLLDTFYFSPSVEEECRALHSGQVVQISSEIKVNTADNSMSVNGQARVTGICGSRMVVTTYDITDGQQKFVSKKPL